MWVWGVIVGLSLLPFFQFFKKGDPHQLAAIAELENSIDDVLLTDEAEWFQMWKTSGIHQEVYGVPYYSQLDSLTGYGFRECFDSAAAMVAAFHRVVQSQDTYRIRRRKHGDTTEVHAQVSTLQSFGLNAEFRKNVRVEDIEIEIDAGRPLMVGWLHKGDFTKGNPAVCDSEGCGHWSVIIGYDKDDFIAMDPMGKPNMQHGGHDTTKSGELIRMSRAAFYQRFLIEGEASGWAIFVDR
ncbi:MAG: hypothetical protein CL855_02170 [Cryomorphaceae bacterium]|nr:hypothetical protein [Cryomorphaceae bacterium]